MEKKQYKKNNGGIWETKGREGETFFSGSIDLDGNSYKFKAYKNKFKKPGERTPDYQIYLDEAPKETYRKVDREPIKQSSDDIPF